MPGRGFGIASETQQPRAFAQGCVLRVCEDEGLNLRCARGLLWALGPWARHLSRELRAAAAGDEQAGDAGQRDGAGGGDEVAVDGDHVEAPSAGGGVGAGGVCGDKAT